VAVIGEAGLEIEIRGRRDEMPARLKELTSFTG